MSATGGKADIRQACRHVGSLLIWDIEPGRVCGRVVCRTMVMRFSSIHWLLGYSRDFAFFGTVRSFVPSLHDGLMCDLSAAQFDQSNAEHLGPAGIGAALTEGQSITFGCVDVDLMGHRAAADVVPEGCNG